MDKLPTRLVKILDLIEESFRRLVNGNYIIKEAYKVFPRYLCYFFKENLWTTDTKFLYYKVIDIDVKKVIKVSPL
jgi:hypothetical protein